MRSLAVVLLIALICFPAAGGVHVSDDRNSDRQLPGNAFPEEWANGPPIRTYFEQLGYNLYVFQQTQASSSFDGSEWTRVNDGDGAPPLGSQAQGGHVMRPNMAITTSKAGTLPGPADTNGYVDQFVKTSGLAPAVQLAGDNNTILLINVSGITFGHTGSIFIGFQNETTLAWQDDGTNNGTGNFNAIGFLFDSTTTPGTIDLQGVIVRNDVITKTSTIATYVSSAFNFGRPVLLAILHDSEDASPASSAADVRTVFAMRTGDEENGFTEWATQELQDAATDTNAPGGNLKPAIVNMLGAGSASGVAGSVQCQWSSVAYWIETLDG